MVGAIRRFHLVVGLAGAIAFLATGAYMDRFHDHLRGYDDAQRLLFRSTHIYLLLAAVANTLLGLYLTPAPVAWRRAAQNLGSLALLATPLLFVAGFCTEPWLSELARPWSRPGVYLSFAGMILHVLAALRFRVGGSAVETRSQLAGYSGHGPPIGPASRGAAGSARRPEIRPDQV